MLFNQYWTSKIRTSHNCSHWPLRIGTLGVERRGVSFLIVCSKSKKTANFLWSKKRKSRSDSCTIFLITITQYILLRSQKDIVYSWELISNTFQSISDYLLTIAKTLYHASVFVAY